MAPPGKARSEFSAAAEVARLRSASLFPGWRAITPGVCFAGLFLFPCSWPERANCSALPVMAGWKSRRHCIQASQSGYVVIFFLTLIKDYGMGQNVQAKFNAAQNEIRIAIMNFVIEEKRPFNIGADGFAALKGIHLSSQADFAGIIDVLRNKDGLVDDGNGNVNFIYPVSAQPTKHLVKLADGREFAAMCAIDALGAAFTFRLDSEVRSQCSMCGADVYVKIQGGKAVEHTPQEVHALSFELAELANWAGSC